jgi:hypothetical protein
MKKIYTAGGCMLVALGLGVAIVAGTMLSGWVLTMLWAWFVTPTFGLPLLSIPQAIGLCLVVNMLAGQSRTGKDGDKDWANLLAVAFVGPLLVLAMGWIIAGFLP